MLSARPIPVGSLDTFSDRRRSSKLGRSKQVGVEIAVLSELKVQPDERIQGIRAPLKACTAHRPPVGDERDR